MFGDLAKNLGIRKATVHGFPLFFSSEIGLHHIQVAIAHVHAQGSQLSLQWLKLAVLAVMPAVFLGAITLGVVDQLRQNAGFSHFSVIF